ncbi:MAG: 16S rRNA processing protein RimM [Desulfamplus sp.]|nr:16S rRNA processing protein RimM [Desulfamplus sp.]
MHFHGKEMPRKDILTIGRIMGVHGLKGYLRVRSFSDSRDCFIPGNTVLLKPSGMGGDGGPGKYREPDKRNQGPLNRNQGPLNSYGETGNDGIWYEIEKVAPHRKGILVMFKGVDPDTGQKLVGHDICLPKTSLPDLEEDTYYWQDIIGLKVVDANLGDIGNVVQVIPTGSNDVFVVKALGNPNKEYLVPALAWVVLSVDPDGGEMHVDIPRELRE